MSKYITQEDAEMEDTIKRSDAIRVVDHNAPYLSTRDLVNRLYQIPSADRQGYWIVTTLYVQGKAPKIAVRCSECKRIPLWLGTPLLPTKSSNLLEFCPHCGTRMEGTDDES